MVITRLVSTEKALNMMNRENKLVFVVQDTATKPEIRSALQTMFNTKVLSINTQRTMKGEKRAYVRFETPAIDIATKMGMM